MTPPPRPRTGPPRAAGPRPPRRPPAADPARVLAWRLLRAVDESDAYANLVLPDLLRASALDERDRGLVAELGYGTLRTLGTLDHVIGLCASRPVGDIDAPVRDVLRLGAYQLLRMRVPAHAAVATTVELARQVVGEAPASFVNAVLRRVAERDGDLGAPAYDADPMAHLAVTTAHPRWIVEQFAAALGGDLAETERALLADDERPAVHLVARPGRISRDGLLAELRAAGLDGEPGRWSPYAVRLRGGDPAAIGAVRDGRAAVQDEGSQLAALLATALLPSAPARVLDMCAGPGGKAALLAGALGGGALVATELHEHRARLTARAVRAGAGVGDVAAAWTVACADARTRPWEPGSFDLVLLDAPCTGLGALRRRPESRWRRVPDDVARLAALQVELVDAAVGALRPGGVLVYVVCSPAPAEGVDQVGSLLERHAGTVEAVDVREHIGGAAADATTPWVQLWPHRHGTDAMFLAAVRRVATLPAVGEGTGER